MYSEEASTSVDEERLRVIANGRDPNLVLDHLYSIVVQVAVVHIDLALVGEVLEDRYDSVKDKVSYLGELAVADIEAAVAIEPDLDLVAFVLDDTHLAYLPHSAYSQVEVKGIRHPAAVEVVIVAFPLTSQKLVNSSSAYEADSYSVGSRMNSWSANGLGEGQHRRCLRKLPPAQSSKHVHIDWDAVRLDLVGIPPYWSSTEMEFPLSA